MCEALREETRTSHDRQVILSRTKTIGRNKDLIESKCAFLLYRYNSITLISEKLLVSRAIDVTHHLDLYKTKRSDKYYLGDLHRVIYKYIFRGSNISKSY